VTNIKLPPGIEFNDEVRLLIYRPRGLINRTAVNKIITRIGELETSLKEPFNRFSDTLAADAVDLNFEYVIRVSLYRRQFYGNRPPVKSAILATDATAIHYARLAALVTEGSPLKVCVFEDRKKTAEWLKVPLELLTEK
jgi:Flp pilus assembly pilin Flp